MPDDRNVVDMAAERARQAGGGEPPNGYATAADLLRLEMRLGDRLTRLETQFETRWETTATKEDLKSLKIWALSGVIGGMAVTAAIVSAVLKLFS